MGFADISSDEATIAEVTNRGLRIDWADRAARNAAHRDAAALRRPYGPKRGSYNWARWNKKLDAPAPTQ